MTIINSEFLATSNNTFFSLNSYSSLQYKTGMYHKTEQETAIYK
jgi:hypothetical protein